MSQATTTAYGLVILPYDDNHLALPALKDEMTLYYPGFEGWYRQRVITGKRPVLQFYREQVIGGERVFTALGWVILKPLPDKRVKISTLFILPEHRGNGLMQTLLRLVIDWCTSAQSIYITIPDDRMDFLGSTLEKLSFHTYDYVYNLYREGMVEYFLYYQKPTNGDKPSC